MSDSENTNVGSSTSGTIVVNVPPKPKTNPVSSDEKPNNVTANKQQHKSNL